MLGGIILRLVLRQVDQITLNGASNTTSGISNVTNNDGTFTEGI